MSSRGLSPDEVRRFYDRIGRRQDSQAFYEDPATDSLTRAAQLYEAKSVIEVGCGTGRLAERLLSQHLPPAARYLGVELSPVMAHLAAERVRRWRGRADVVCSADPMRLPVPDGTADRLLAVYVFDLLSPEDMAALVEEAERVLAPDGLACVASLTHGEGRFAQLVSDTWAHAWQRWPVTVGGCRPVQVAPVFISRGWSLQHRGVLRAWGISSEVLVAAPPTAP